MLTLQCDDLRGSAGVHCTLRQTTFFYRMLFLLERTTPNKTVVIWAFGICLLKGK